MTESDDTKPIRPTPIPDDDGWTDSHDVSDTEFDPDTWTDALEEEEE
jgi:hypothetical protein